MPLDQTNWPTQEIEVDETTALLIRARSFVARGWCRDASARDEEGNSVEPWSYRADQWCAWGALRAAGILDSMHPAFLLLTAATGAGQLIPFNDSQRTVKPILAAFDRAIAASGEG